MLKDTVQLGTGPEKDSRGQKLLDNTSTGSSTVSSLRGVSRSKVAGVLAMLTALSGVRCTLNMMGEGKPLDDAMVTDCGDANQEKGTGGTGGTVTPWPEAGDEDVKDGGVIDVAVDVPNDCPDSTVDGDAGVDVLEEVDAAGEDVVIDVADEDVADEDVAQDVSEEPDVSDAPEDVAEDISFDVPVGVGAVNWSNNMDNYMVMHIRDNKVQYDSSSPDVVACQTKPFTSIGIQGGDLVELMVKDNDTNDGGSCAVDGGAGIDCDNVAPALILPINISPSFIEGRCAKYAYSCSGWNVMKLEYNDPSGFTTLPLSFESGYWKYSVPQSCTSKVYKLHF